MGKAIALNDELSRELAELLKGHPGKCKVSVALYSAAEHINVDVAAKAMAVNVNEELMHRLESLGQVEVKLG